MTGEIRKEKKKRCEIPADADPVDLVRNGKLLVFRSALQEIHEFDTIRQNVLDVVQRIAGTEPRRRLEERGFEHLHKLLDGHEICEINSQVKKQIRNLVPAIVKKFVHGILEYREPFYIGTNPMIRFFVPHDHFVQHRELFSEKQGSLKIQGPHHDGWFRNPVNCLNLWMAIGCVRRGNGMVIYRDRWGEFLDHDGNREIPRDESLGQCPVTFSLDPGDVLMFHGGHLHTSELNRTDETRFVITSRITTEKPRFSSEYTWRAFHHSRLVDTPLSVFSTAGSYLSMAFLKKCTDTLREKILETPSKGGQEEPNTKGGSSPGYEEPVRHVAERVDDGLKVDASRLTEGDVTPVSNTVCVLKEDGTLRAFHRFCPHEGADLSKGRVDVQNSRLYCAWHNLCMDYRDGTHDCVALTKLQTYRVEKLDGNSFLVHV